MDSAFQQALDFIYSFIDFERQPGRRTRQTWDLRRVQDLLERLGNPHLKPKTVHIAGSKGKGSTAAMTASVLMAAGYRTGLYTSPHLHFYNERMRIDGRYISNEELVALVARVKPAVEAVNAEGRFGRLTTFEVSTAIGFSHFAHQATDYQVIEVGLGGRLDATNVVRPDVCVITSISLEHTDILGDSLGAIATEKAGIIKPGVPVVIAPQAPEAGDTITRIALERQARPVQVGRDVTYEFLGTQDYRQRALVKGKFGEYRLSIPLLGRYQLDNAAAAVATMEVLIEGGAAISADHIAGGVSSVSWEARLQVLNDAPLVVADGAHNRDSIAKLCDALKEYFKFEKSVLILGLSGDKDLEGIVSEVAPRFDRVIVTRSIHPRAMSTAPILDAFRRNGINAFETDDISAALPLALQMAGERDLVCVAGSLFVAAGAVEQAMALGLAAAGGRR